MIMCRKISYVCLKASQQTTERYLWGCSLILTSRVENRTNIKDTKQNITAFF